MTRLAIHERRERRGPYLWLVQGCTIKRKLGFLQNNGCGAKRSLVYAAQDERR